MSSSIKQVCGECGASGVRPLDKDPWYGTVCHFCGMHFSATFGLLGITKGGVEENWRRELCHQEWQERLATVVVGDTSLADHTEFLTAKRNTLWRG